MAHKKIFTFTTEKSEEIINGCLMKLKKEYGIMNTFMIEKWLLMGIEKEGPEQYKKMASEYLKERYSK